MNIFIYLIRQTLTRGELETVRGQIARSVETGIGFTDSELDLLSIAINEHREALACWYPKEAA